MMDQDQGDSIDDYFNSFRLIKKGAFGKVFQCSQLNEREEKRFAVKVIDKCSVKRHKVQNLRNQVRILETIQHQNIVKFLGIIENERFIYIKMEVAKGGTLGQFIKKRIERNEKIQEQQISRIMKSILKGIQYLHSVNIIHRDLKPQNILIGEEGNLNSIKIADFGMSIKIEVKNQKISTHCGTLIYMAPEIILRKSYSKSIDIWSSAIIMFMLFNNGNHPLIPKNKRGSITAEQYGLFINKPWPQLQKQQANDLIKKLSTLEQLERYSPKDALKHPFLGGDYAPLTYLQSFKGFQIHHSLNQLLRTTIIVSSFCEKSTKLTVSKQYLDNVQKYNQITIDRKIKQSLLKRDSSFKKVSVDEVRVFFDQFSNRKSSQISSSTSPIKKTKFSQFSNVKLIQNAFLSQTTELKQPILIKKNNSKFHIGKPKKNQRVGSIFSLKNPHSQGRSSIEPRSTTFKAINSISLSSHNKMSTNAISTLNHVNFNPQSNANHLLKSINRSVQKHSERDTYTSAHKRRISLNNKSQKQTIISSFFKK